MRPATSKLCSIVKSELLYGARRSRREEQNWITERFFQPFESFPFTDRTRGGGGPSIWSMGGMGTPIGPNDLLIAAVARSTDLVLVTRNVRGIRAGFGPQGGGLVRLAGLRRFVVSRLWFLV